MEREVRQGARELGLMVTFDSQGCGTTSVLEAGGVVQPSRKSEERESGRGLWWSIMCVELLLSDAWGHREQYGCEAGEAASARLVCVPTESTVCYLWWLSGGADGKYRRPTPPRKPPWRLPSDDNCNILPNKPWAQHQGHHPVHSVTEKLHLRGAEPLPAVTQWQVAALSLPASHAGAHLPPALLPQFSGLPSAC